MARGQADSSGEDRIATDAQGEGLLALPVWQGRVSPVLDVATHWHLRSGDGGMPREIALPPAPAAELAHALRDLGVRVILCGGVSDGLLHVLESAGIRVVPHLCGPVGAVVGAYLRGRLGSPRLAMPGCGGRRCGCRRREGGRPDRHRR